jgi:hypothetical protein
LQVLLLVPLLLLQVLPQQQRQMRVQLPSHACAAAHHMQPS